jgi:putative exosortase-associated protein (TIGR04073 family)
MRRPFLMVLAALALMLAVVAPVSAQVEREHADDRYRENSDVEKMAHKLGRGVSNLLFGWIEIPRQIAKGWRETEPFTGTIVGLVKGVGWGFARTVAGAYEIISFPFPVPRDYVPVMQPEFVLPTVWGDRLPLYSDEYMAGSAGTGAALDYGRTSTVQPTMSSGSTRTY